jgi:hypothetical protein
MPKFIKKPIVIDAYQWDETKSTLDKAGCGYMSYNGHSDRPDEVKNLRILACEGIRSVDKGDYIIQDENGDFFVCKPKIFEATYDLI